MMLTDTFHTITFSDTTGATLTSERLARAIAQVRTARGIIVLAGDAQHFCLGLDLDGFVRGECDLTACSRQFCDLLTALSHAPVPVVAVVEGAALGGGLGLASAADYVVAHPRARFGLPEALLGLIPAMVFPWIAARAGITTARRLALGAPPLDSDQALRVGLVDEVSADPWAAADVFIERMRKMDARAIAEIKRMAATHYAVNAAWLAEAGERFGHLASSPGTGTRIARFAEGLAPWQA
jgi:enoyl-CoA hydratase/carnithine racemase